MAGSFFPFYSQKDKSQDKKSSRKNYTGIAYYLYSKENI